MTCKLSGHSSSSWSSSACKALSNPLVNLRIIFLCSGLYLLLIWIILYDADAGSKRMFFRMQLQQHCGFRAWLRLLICFRYQPLEALSPTIVIFFEAEIIRVPTVICHLEIVVEYEFFIKMNIKYLIQFQIPPSIQCNTIVTHFTHCTISHIVPL